jgi:hypothetical protein
MHSEWTVAAAAAAAVALNTDTDLLVVPLPSADVGGGNSSAPPFTKAKLSNREQYHEQWVGKIPAQALSKGLDQLWSEEAPESSKLQQGVIHHSSCPLFFNFFSLGSL